MSAISTRTLDAAEDYLRTIEPAYDPLSADSGWIVQRLKDWAEETRQGWGRNDVEASDIAIHLAQRAGRRARSELNVKPDDRVTVNGHEYIVGLTPWPKAEHRATLELFVPGGREDRTRQ